MTDITVTQVSPSPDQEPSAKVAQGKAWTEAHYHRGRRAGLLECAHSLRRLLADFDAGADAHRDAFRMRLALVAVDLFAEATES